MPLPLLEFPRELVDKVLMHAACDKLPDLDFASLCNLRLVNKVLSERVSLSYFRDIIFRPFDEDVHPYKSRSLANMLNIAKSQHATSGQTLAIEVKPWTVIWSGSPSVKDLKSFCGRLGSSLARAIKDLNKIQTLSVKGIQLYDSDYDAWEGETDRINQVLATTVLVALHKTPMPNLRRLDWELPRFGLTISPQFRASLARLEKAHLLFEVETTWMDESPNKPVDPWRETPGLITLSNALPAELSHLCFSFFRRKDEKDDNTRLDMDGLFFPAFYKLQSLSLHNVEISHTKLLKMIERSKDTLHTIRLSNVFLKSGTWADMLRTVYPAVLAEVLTRKSLHSPHGRHHPCKANHKAMALADASPDSLEMGRVGYKQGRVHFFSVSTTEEMLYGACDHTCVDEPKRERLGWDGDGCAERSMWVLFRSMFA